MTARTLASLLAPMTAAIALAGCSLAPPYSRPTTPSATDWKPIEGWRPANPSDGAPRSDWWTAFNDATLNDYMTRALAHNQTIAQAAANYREARAATREARASLFPTVTANGQVTHSYSGGSTTVTSNGTIALPGTTSTDYRVDVQASWQPDFFGQVLNTVRGASYTAQARLADLANSQLTVEGELASDYLSLRAADAMIASMAATVDGYQRSLKIATDQYNSGIVARTDVFQAQSQLASAQSDLEGERRTRAQFEDAIAVLIGENAASFQIAAVSAWTPVTPDVPAELPSALLERRPDVASAERATASANAQIGVQRAAFFPTVPLTGQAGVNGVSLGNLFSAPGTFWSLGASVAETLLDFGARSARVAEARATYDAAVANYRQVALTAFQEVQDDLVAVVILARQETLLQAASVAADRSEQTLLNQYRAGQTVYSNVVTAQATAQTARRALLQAQLDRQNAAVALIQALGGGWDQTALDK